MASDYENVKADYTPTTEWVIAGWVDARATDGIPADVAHKEIDRWLAEHDREVKAEAWDEGWDEGVLWPDGKLQNPYREVSK